jgi:tRNA A-37 threonylcarbamoyl transferase component Bud32/tetratricopeptide (TPR) repeat protein
MSLTSIQHSIEELRRFPRDQWLDLIRSDQSHRWRQGIGILVEEYFLELPEIRADAEEALVLITGEFLLRREVGETFDVGEYQTRFPEFADHIAVQFCVDDFLSSTGRVEAQADDGAVRDRELPGYEFLEEIGRGAGGVVYKARQESLDRFVAIKVVAIPGADPKLLARQRQEAEILARLHHPNVVHIYEVVDYRGFLHLVMEYVDGTTLAARVGGILPVPEESARLALTLANTVQAVHEAGVLHRDLKPSNVLRTAAGELKISDFGLAKLRSNSSLLTTTDCVLGTPSYMAPEQAVGEAHSIGPEADVYSLGAILYELLTGRAPFLGATVLDTLSLIRSQEPVAPRHLQPRMPRDLETICLKCLAKSPKQRYAKAAELAGDLERFLTGQPITARRATQPERLVRWCWRNPVVAGLTGTVASLLVAAVALLATSNAQIRHESDARARALRQKDAALDMAYLAVDQMLTRVANDKFSDLPMSHPLRQLLLEDALRLYQGFVAQADNPGRLQGEMANVLHRMVGLQRELGRYADAANSSKQCIELLEAAAPTDPHPPLLRERLASAQLDLGYTLECLAGPKSDDPKVEAQYRKALQQFTALERDWPQRRQPYVICLRYLAGVADRRADHAEAERLWKESIARGEAYLEQRPDDIDTRSSVCWACVEYFNYVLSAVESRATEAEAVLQQGLRHAAISLEQNSRSVQAREVDASLRFNLAISYCRRGRVAEALPLFEQASDEIQSLCASSPWTPSYWQTAQWFHAGSTNALQQAGGAQEAQAAVNRTYQWLRKIAPEVPDQPVPQQALKTVQNNVIQLLLATGQEHEADELEASVHNAR